MNVALLAKDRWGVETVHGNTDGTLLAGKEAAMEQKLCKIRHGARWKPLLWVDEWRWQNGLRVDWKRRDWQHLVSGERGKGRFHWGTVVDEVE